MAKKCHKFRSVLPTGDLYRQIWSKLAKFDPNWKF